MKELLAPIPQTAKSRNSTYQMNPMMKISKKITNQIYPRTLTLKARKRRLSPNLNTISIV